MLKWCDGRVVSNKVWTPGLFTLRIAVPEVQPFTPGQFLHLALTMEDGEEVNRAYSVASPHGEEIEFFIVKVDGGKLTPKLEQLKPGDRVQIKERGAGGFTLAKTPDAQSIWLIGTGTGLAPFIAMLRDPEIWKRYSKIIVCHGVRKIVDLGYREELSRLTQEKPGQLVYVPTASREAGDGILDGRLTTLLETGALEAAARVKFCPDSSAVMMCGNPDMLKDMEEMLGQRGLKRHRSKAPGNIVVETYW